jgi:type IV pilus assembly protein PilM
MDLNKEIKLSDLVRRPKKKTQAGAKPSGTGLSDSPTSRRQRKQEIVGLKIGASQIAASRVVNNGGPAQLVQLARLPLEPGVVVAGEVRDISALASALGELFRTHKLPRRGVRLGIATNRIGVRSFELEGIEDERQLANAIRFRAYEELSIPADEAVLDYRVVSEGVNEAGQRSRRVVLAAAYRDSIDRYVAACDEAGIEVAAVDLEAFALLRAVAPASARAEEAAVVAVTIGHDRTTLAISDGVVCDFTRVLEWGGANLEDGIARELGLTVDGARQLKLALDLGDDASDGEDPRLARARAALARELQTLARELIASLRFYQSQTGSLAISTVLITGGTTMLRGLAEELERLTRVRVRRANPLAGVQIADGVGTRDDLASLAVAIGLGIEA